MNDGEKPLSDAELDALFANSRDQVTEASPDFFGRMLADAAEQSSGVATSALSGLEPRNPVRGLWSQITEAFGGWRGGAVITASLFLSLYIGFADPAGVDTVSGLVATLSGEIVETEASLYDLLLEG